MSVQFSKLFYAFWFSLAHVPLGGSYWTWAVIYMVVHFLKALLFSLGLFCVCKTWREAGSGLTTPYTELEESPSPAFSSLGFFSPYSLTPWSFFSQYLWSQRFISPQTFSFLAVMKFFMTGASHFVGHYLNPDFSPQSTCCLCLCLYLYLSIDT